MKWLQLVIEISEVVITRNTACKYFASLGSLQQLHVSTNNMCIKLREHFDVDLHSKVMVDCITMHNYIISATQVT